MASSKDYLDFVLGQLSGKSDITYRAMMGEYIIYYRGKIIGGIYDNRLLVKPTESVMKLIPDAKLETPYAGAKPMVIITDIENSELLKRVFDTLWVELSNKRKENVFKC